MTTKSPDNLRDRWLLSIHEAAHAVISAALGGGVDAVEIGASGTKGCCHYSAELPRFPSALRAAAGRAAEELLAHEPAPELTPLPSKMRFPSATAEEAPQEMALCSNSDFSSDPNDSWHIALCAITGQVEQPENWEPFVFRARHEAAYLCHMHRAAILRVAAALFEHWLLLNSDLKLLLPQNPLEPTNGHAP